MSPINKPGISQPVNRISSRSSSAGRRGSASHDWFSPSNTSTASSIHPTAMFNAGTSIEDISAQVLSHISELEDT